MRRGAATLRSEPPPSTISAVIWHRLSQTQPPRLARAGPGHAAPARLFAQIPKSGCCRLCNSEHSPD
eukprot:6355181-Alexandrium_andersonii.AAC.1